MIYVTVGDTAKWEIFLQDEEGNRLTLTGATFSSKIRGANGTDVTFSNSEHTADPDQVANKGRLEIAPTTDQANNLKPSNNPQELMVQVTQGGKTRTYRAYEVMVMPATPRP